MGVSQTLDNSPHPTPNPTPHTINLKGHGRGGGPGLPVLYRGTATVSRLALLSYVGIRWPRGTIVLVFFTKCGRGRGMMCTFVGGGERGGGVAFHGGVVVSFYLRICRGGGVNCTSGPP